MNDIPKPLLKWVGGKSQIIEKILERFPYNINNYYEPFIGGGSVLIGLLWLVKKNIISISGNIYASDVNKCLIHFYKTIQSNPDEFIVQLKHIITDYNSIKTDTKVNRSPLTKEDAFTSQESYYYWIRKLFNSYPTKDDIRYAALFYFINKTCFRGIYREGPNGINVPFGHYKNVQIIDEQHIKFISTLIQFYVRSFDFLGSIQLVSDDFIYMDPPYAPEKTTSFVQYNKDGFDFSNHEKLFNICKSLPCKFLQSNANVALVTNSFSDKRFKIEVIKCRRAINSKKPESTTEEVLISSN